MEAIGVIQGLCRGCIRIMENDFSLLRQSPERKVIAGLLISFSDGYAYCNRLGWEETLNTILNPRP